MIVERGTVEAFDGMVCEWEVDDLGQQDERLYSVVVIHPTRGRKPTQKGELAVEDVVRLQAQGHTGWLGIAERVEDQINRENPHCKDD